MIDKDIIYVTPININIIDEIRFDHLSNSIVEGIYILLILLIIYIFVCMYTLIVILIIIIKLYFLPYHQHSY